MWQIIFLTFGWDLVLASAYSNFRKSVDSTGRRQYQVQNGPCSYTFSSPETDSCRSSSSPYMSNAVQRDAPLDYDDSVQRSQVSENILENNTQWSMKSENYIQDNMKKEMVEIQQNVVQNQTAVMIEIGTSLSNQTAAQTRKSTDVEAQVLNQTTRLESQLLQHSISTNKLEKQILDQTSEINKLQNKNSFLEQKVSDMEGKHSEQLQSMKEQKDELQVSVSKQSSVIDESEKKSVTATVNNSLLQKQQHDLMETVNSLSTMMSSPNSKSSVAIRKEEQTTFRDCAEIFKSGLTTSGIYTSTFPNSTEEIKAYCDMDVGGGGWTVIQHREDGSVDFQRTWKEYKEGFGSPSGEYWSGNEFVSQSTGQHRYVLKIQSKDWEGNEAHSSYDHFYLAGEESNYRIHLTGLTGTAGKISSISQPGSDFSTKDSDNDKCICKCSQMLSGGWWFDACGPSNLNGQYYPQKQNTNKFNGIKWYYWKGSGYSLKATTMMIRPADF